MKRFAIIGVMLLAGCPSFTTMGTARTIEKGKGQFYVALGGISLQDFEQDAAGEANSIGLPTFEFGGRWGVADGVEVGGKVFPIGAELNAKFALIRPETPAGLNLAVGPAASVYAFPSDEDTFTLVWLHLPLLVGLNMGGSELVIAPRISDLMVSGGGDSINTVFAGGSLGFAWKVSDGFRILPEIAFTTPIFYAVEAGGTSASDTINPRGAMVQFNVGFLMGGD
jgi:hypothetical protein